VANDKALAQLQAMQDHVKGIESNLALLKNGIANISMQLNTSGLAQAEVQVAGDITFKRVAPEPEGNPVNNAISALNAIDKLKWTKKTGNYGDYEYAFTTKEKGGPISPEGQAILNELGNEKSVQIGQWKISKSKDNGALYRK